MRDCDCGILQQLLVAHSTINDLRQGLNESQDTTENFMDSSKDTLDDIKESFESSGGSHENQSFKRETTPNIDMPLNGIASSTPVHKPSTAKDEEDILRQFFGTDDMTKLGYLKSGSSSNDRYSEETDKGDTSSHKQDKKPTTSATSNKTMAELKLEAKNEGRSSVAFEMQLFRQQLQEQAKSELAAFDKEFDDSPKDLSTLLEPEARSYRHSILNRMDELLYPKQPQPEQRSHRSGSHIRQSSEPVVFHDIRTLEGSLAQRGSSSRGNPGNRGYFPSSQSTQFMSPNGRKSSEPAHNSFRLPSSRTTVELSRSGSGYLSSKHRPSEMTHYDTSVIKKKSSSRNNTLEKSSSKQSLQYSVESLEREETAILSPNRGGGGGIDDSLVRDFQSPEHKSVSIGGGASSYRQQQHEGGSVKAKSLDIYPETPPTKTNTVISPPYLQTTTNQQLQQMYKWSSNNSGRKKTGPKTFIRGNSENSWL